MQHGSIVYEGMSIGVCTRLNKYKYTMEPGRIEKSFTFTTWNLFGLVSLVLKSSQQQHFYLHRNAKQHHKTKSTHNEIKTEQILIQSMYSFH